MNKGTWGEPDNKAEQETEKPTPLGAATLDTNQIIGRLAQENHELRTQLAKVTKEAERLADTCYVLQAAPRPVVQTILGPIEATAAGVNTLAVALYKARYGAVPAGDA